MAKGDNQGTKKEAFLIPARQNRVIVCEELDFTWDGPELKELKKWWTNGIGIKRIAEHFDRDPDEIIIALNPPSQG
jgi:hypothetical protein